MKSTAATVQQPVSALETSQGASPPSQTAKAPAPDLRDTLTETHETILMVEQTLIPATEAKGEQLAKANNDRTGSREQEDPYEAFFQACFVGDLNKARALVATGIDVNCQPGAATALHIAASNGHEAIICMLSDEGANVDPRLGSAQGSLGSHLAGATPLVLAIASHKSSVAELLLSRGANPRAKTHSGLTGEMLRQATGGMELSF